MIEFLLYNYFEVTYLVEFIAATTAFFSLKKYKNTAATFFIWICICLFVGDIFNYYTHLLQSVEFLKPLEGTIFETNNWWSTIYFDIVITVLFLSLYHKILRNERHKIILKYIGYCYLSFSIVLILFNFKRLFIGPYPILYILSTIIIFMCVIFYLIEILKSEHLLKFSISVYFYITIAIFIWWLVVTPLVFYDMYYTLNDKNFILLKNSIYIFSNIFMYLTFTIGLIVSKPEKRA